MIKQYKDGFYIDGDPESEVRILVKMSREDVEENYGKGVVMSVYKEVGSFLKVTDELGGFALTKESIDSIPEVKFKSFEEYFSEIKNDMNEEYFDFTKAGEGIFIELINGTIIHILGDDAEIELCYKHNM